jgi:hypothetical protein
MAGPRPVAGSPFGLSWPLLVGIFACLATLNAGLLNDPDTYWHLAAANWMFEHQSIPASDPFSHTMRGAPWVTHEWLSEVLLGGAYRLLGWTGVVVLASGAFAASLALMCRFLLRHLEPVYALSFTALAALMIQAHLLARPHALVYPLVVVWGMVLVQAREEGRAPAWPWFLLLGAWANLHGSFTLGLALAGFFAAEALWEARAGERRRVATAWGSFLVLSLVAVLITPNGFDGLAFTFHTNGLEFSLAHIAEWRSPDFQRLQPVEIALMVGGLVLFLRGLRLPLSRAVLVLGLVHLALKHGRHVDVLGLLAPLILAEAAGRQWGRNDGTGAAATIDYWFLRLAGPARPLTIAAALALLLAATLLAARSGQVNPQSESRPEAALRAAQAAAPGGQVMNSYHFGGYLIYSGIQPAIDGRADMYGDTFVRDYTQAIDLQMPDQFFKMLDKYDIGWTIFAPDVPAIALLDRMPGWRRIHSDKTAVVHVKWPGN